jgi:hypothetical protein
MAHDQVVVGSNLGTVYWLDESDDAGYYIIEMLGSVTLGKVRLAKVQLS